MKILQGLPYLENAGTERHALTLSQALLARGCTIKLLAPDGPLASGFAQLGIEHIPFPRFRINPFPSLRAIRAGIERALDWGADIIHIHAGVELLYAVHMASKGIRHHRWGGRLLPPATVFTVHSYFGRCPRIDYFLAARLSKHRAEQVIAVSQADARTLERYGLVRGYQLTAIHNGVPDPGIATTRQRRQLRCTLAKKCGFAPHRALCVLAGRLAKQKGIDVLLKALAVYRGTPVTVLIAGDGDLRRSLETQARCLGLLLNAESQVETAERAQVVFLGTRDDIPELLAAADLFILPSRMEGLSLALVEAHASGLPCLATDVGGNGEIIEEGITGRLVPAEDPSALAMTLDSMLEDKQRLKVWGRAARRRYECCFTVEKMAGKTWETYRDAIGKVR